jgi:hypothetical protein
MGTLTHNAEGKRNFIRKNFIKHRQVGERANSSHFSLKVIGYPNLQVKIASCQLPEMTRQPIESFGPMGVGSNFQGNLKNTGEITVMIEETIKGDTLADLKAIVDGKIYVDVEISLTPEELAGGASVTRKLLECYLASEAIDLATESVTELVKVSVTVNYNWVD